MAEETKERILDAAERLFADSGFSATSLRDITGEAGVNLASVNYHFGSKEALLSAILDRRFRPINDRRLAVLDALETAAGEGGPAVEEIVAALVGPPFESLAELEHCGAKFLKLVGQIHSRASEEIRVTFLRQFDRVLARFTAAFQRALPDLDPDEVATRVAFVVGAMAHAMTWGGQIPFASRAARPAGDSARLLESLTRFAAAGMAAPRRDPIADPIPAPAPAHVPAPAAAAGGSP